LLFDYVERFCEGNRYTYRVGKDTETVKRAFIDYGEQGTPLKVELSYRRLAIEKQDFNVIEGIAVYSVDQLCQMKAAAYLSRDRIRDLYDLTFLIDRYYDKLSIASKEAVRNAFEYKDLDQFDYLIKTQDDPLINIDAMETRFLEAYEKVGLTPVATAPKTREQGVTRLEVRGKAFAFAEDSQAGQEQRITPAEDAARARKSATAVNARRTGTTPHKGGPER
jgi:hypothetical protein